MTNLEKVNNYLDKCKMFYVTTIEGDKPKCRPFSFKMVCDNKLWFGVGTFKDCYKQMLNNPSVEIVASDGMGFIRYFGKATFVDSKELLAKAFKEADYLPKLYNEQNGHKFRMFYLNEGKVEYHNLKELVETFTL